MFLVSGISVKELVGQGTSSNISLPRFASYYLCGCGVRGHASSEVVRLSIAGHTRELVICVFFFTAGHGCNHHPWSLLSARALMSFCALLVGCEIVGRRMLMPRPTCHHTRPCAQLLWLENGDFGRCIIHFATRLNVRIPDLRLQSELSRPQGMTIPLLLLLQLILPASLLVLLPLFRQRSPPTQIQPKTHRSQRLRP